MRCFIAINLPNTIQNYLAGLIESIRQDKVKWVEPKNLHLTLAFLGEVAEEAMPNLIKQMETIQLPSFALKLDRLGAFPNADQPRVINISVQDKTNTLFQLYKMLEQTLTQGNWPLDAKPFSGHITLGRVKEGSQPININLNVPIDNLEFTIKEFSLIRSQLTPQGPIYSVLQNYPLCQYP